MRRFAALSLAIMLTVLVGCGGNQPATKPASGGQPPTQSSQSSQPAPQPSGPKKVSGKLRVAYIDTASSSPLFLAATKYWPALGLQVEMTKQPSGAGVMAQVSTGQADVGNTGIGAALFNALAQKLPVEMVSALHWERPEDYLLISTKSSAKDVASLKGKKVVINAKGVITEYVLEKALNSAGLSTKDVQMSTMAFPDMVKALETGAVDGAIVTQPFFGQAVKAGVAFSPFKEPKLPYAPMTVAVFNSDWTSKNPDLAVAAMVGILQASREIERLGKYEGDLVDAILKYTATKKEVLESIKPARYDPDGKLDASFVQEQQKFNMDRGYLEYKELLPAEKLLNTKWTAEALKQLGK